MISYSKTVRSLFFAEFERTANWAAGGLAKYATEQIYNNVNIVVVTKGV
jgi:hypothetical protein